MNGTDRQQELVDDYLRRLERAAYALPPDRRAELVLQIKGHIDEADGVRARDHRRGLDADRAGTPWYA